MAATFTDQASYVDGLAEYVSASPSSYHAAHEAARVLEAAGFKRLEETVSWQENRAGDKHYVLRDGAIIAWVVGADVDKHSAVNVFGAHTDSPSFKLVPDPAFEKEGWAQAAVEVYGGPLLNSWLDRDLEFAGRLVLGDGSEVLTRTGPVARIPQLAIHLDRDANNGLKLNRQANTQPLYGVDVADASPLKLVAEAAGVQVDDIAGHDLFVADTQAATLLGVDKKLFASSRMDNLSSVYAGLVALAETVSAPQTISMLAAFDHEELGSETRSGASGPFLADVLDRIFAGLGADQADRAVSTAKSWCLSADAGHSVHPNYGEKHSPNVRPVAGRGPVLKVNAQQRYATDAHGAALWQRLCDAAEVSGQVFVCNNEIPCGSTIGPLTATRLGIRTVDAGVPLLSMHSARELVHTDDLYALYRVAERFFAGR